MKSSFVLPCLYLILSLGWTSIQQPAPLHIQIEEEHLLIDGIVTPAFPALSWFQTRLGPARKIPRSIYNLYIWDKQGLCLFEESGSGNLHTLHMALRIDDRENRPQGIFSGKVEDQTLSFTPETSKVRLLEQFSYDNAYESGMLGKEFGPFTLSLYFEDDLLKTIEISQP